MYRPKSLCVFLCTLAAGFTCSAGFPARAAESQPTREVDSKPATRTPDVIFVPTPEDVVARMLELAKVSKTDVLYDLGCGDGRIVVSAAKKYQCKGIGYDIDPERIRESRENVEKNEVGSLVSIVEEDIFKLDLSGANVITLYLLPDLNVRLIPQLQKLKPGSRIVSHDFRMKGVKPDKVVRMKSREDGQRHTIYLWTTPLKVAKKGDNPDRNKKGRQKKRKQQELAPVEGGTLVPGRPSGR